MERRRHERHDLSAPVRFDWELADGASHQGTGITRDLSAVGLYVMTDDAPPAGVTVQFEVDLESARPGSGVNVRAKGQVTRVETPESGGRLAGFAISSRRMRLEKPEPPAT